MRAAPPTRTLVGPSQRVGLDAVCGVCRRPFVEGCVEVCFDCGHGVHAVCLSSFRTRFVACPRCGRSQPKIDDASGTPALDAMIEALS